MRYSEEEALGEIIRRSKRIARDRRRKRETILIASAVLIAICASVIILSIPAGNRIYDTMTLYGSFLLNQSTGGYILVAVIAFITGIAVAIICRKYQNEKKDPED